MAEEGAARVRAAIAQLELAAGGGGAEAAAAFERTLVIPASIRGKMIGRGGLEVAKVETESAAVALPPSLPPFMPSPCPLSYLTHSPLPFLPSSIPPILLPFLPSPARSPARSRHTWCQQNSFTPPGGFCCLHPQRLAMSVRVRPSLVSLPPPPPRSPCCHRRPHLRSLARLQTVSQGRSSSLTRIA